MDQAPVGKKREIIAALAVLIAMVVIVAAASVSAKSKKTDTSAVVSTPIKTTAPVTTTTTSTTPVATASTYKDGNYAATGSYNSPGGEESVGVSITLQNDIITASSVKSEANDPEAGQYQSQFISSYKSLVVGKNIANVKLSRVSGSSLTSQGFNSALQQIKNAAK